MSRRKRNYIAYSFVITMSVIVIMLVMRAVPSFSLNEETTIKQVDIIGDIVSIDNEDIDSSISSAGLSGKGEWDSPKITMPAPRRKSAAESQRKDSSKVDEKSESVSNDTVKNERVEPKSKNNAAGVDRRPTVEMEDYSASGNAMGYLAAALSQRGSKHVRMAFMGDSFMEGDMLSADIRDLLQTKYGGCGVGFVPVTSIVAKMRGTVTHSFEGWKTYSIKKSNSSDIDSRFIISGYVYAPAAEGASVTYKTSKMKKTLSGTTRCSFYFVNTKNTKITATVNDTITLTYVPTASDQMQQIIVRNQGVINKIKFSVKNIEGFLAYGAMLDGEAGLAIDNYADRGSSGLQMAKLSNVINGRYNSLTNYDLIVIEYGLNVATKGNMNYTNYEHKMTSIINKIKTLYPSAAILVMGVSDRSSKQNGEYKTMPEIKAMIKAQRQMAKNCGVAFFDTFTAMGGENSMPTFVKKGYAAKDFTHIGPGGARIIAREFVNSLVYELSKY